MTLYGMANRHRGHMNTHVLLLNGTLMKQNYPELIFSLMLCEIANSVRQLKAKDFPSRHRIKQLSLILCAGTEIAQQYFYDLNYFSGNVQHFCTNTDMTQMHWAFYH